MKALNLIVSIIAAVAWTASCIEAQQQEMPPEVIHYADIVLYNGKILTADKNFTIVEAVAVRDGKFLAVGKTDRILAMAGPNTRKIDLKGKTVMPGIIDLHGGPGGPQREYWGKKWIPGERAWRTKQEALEGIKRAIARAKPGEAVIIPRTDLSVPVDPERGGRAGNFCDIFTREEIDSISPNNPLFFVAAVNTTVMAINSKAAEVISPFLPKGVSTPFIKENNICVAEGADLDGILLPGQLAAGDYIYWLEPPDQMLDLYKEQIRRFLSAGVTLGKQHTAPPLMNGLLELWRRGELEMRIRMPFPMVPHISGNSTELPEGESAEAFFRRWPNMSRIGDRMFRFTGMRIAAVGGNIRGGDSWTLGRKIRPYPDRWGNPAPFGGRVQEQKTGTFRGRDVLIQAVRFGWDASCDHCEGDRAIREVVNAFEEGLKNRVVNRPDQRLTTNHTPLVHHDDIKKMAKLGVWSSISTGHVLGGTSTGSDNIEAAVYQYGPDYIHERTAPFKSYVKEGLRPALEGTMWPQAGTAFFWISKAITRKDESPRYGRVWNPEEALSRQEALWGVTLWSAEQLGEEKYLGSIEVGKEADLIVLDRDYMTIPADDIKNIKVLLTMVGGRVVYEVEGALK